MRLKNNRRLAALALMGLSFFAVGCGAKGTVSGKVTYKKTPLPAGFVLLKTESGETFSGRIESDGSYTVENVPTGAAKVGVSVGMLPKEEGGGRKGAVPPKGKSGQPKGAEVPEGVGGSGGNRPSPFPPGFQFPAHYQDPDKSGLTYTVTSGPQEHNITLD